MKSNFYSFHFLIKFSGDGVTQTHMILDVNQTANSVRCTSPYKNSCHKWIRTIIFNTNYESTPYQGASVRDNNVFADGIEPPT